MRPAAPSRRRDFLSTNRIATRSGPPRSHAFTLFEVLLTLTLLAIIAGLTVPALFGSFSSTRLRGAGDEVVAALQRARSQAIDDGEVVQFRFEPEGRKYRVEPWVLEPAEDGAGNADSRANTKDGGAGAGESDPAVTLAGELTEPLTFESGQIAALDPSSGERQVASAASPQSELSTPILFFPDGTATSASLVLKGEKEQYLRIVVRSLTGTARASAVLSRDELDQ